MIIASVVMGCTLYAVGVVACAGIVFGLGHAGDGAEPGVAVVLCLTWPIWIGASLVHAAWKRMTDSA